MFFIKRKCVYCEEEFNNEVREEYCPDCDGCGCCECKGTGYIEFEDEPPICQNCVEDYYAYDWE